MGIRRNAREAALQFLFQNDFIGTAAADDVDLDQQFADFCSLYDVQKKARTYACELLHGIAVNSEAVDALIGRNAKNWRLERLDATDRNIMRVAVFEMAFQEDVPPEVAINEAVEIAKRFSADESPAFINGILDSIKAELGAGADKNPAS